MSPDNAFHHLPELQGRLTPAHASGLRLTDEVLAEACTRIATLARNLTHAEVL